MTQSLLAVVHETAQGLFEIGVMNAQTMRELDTLCLPCVQEYTPEQIKQIRLKNHLTQTR